MTSFSDTSSAALLLENQSAYLAPGRAWRGGVTRPSCWTFSSVSRPDTALTCVGSHILLSAHLDLFALTVPQSPASSTLSQWGTFSGFCLFVYILSSCILPIMKTSSCLLSLFMTYQHIREPPLPGPLRGFRHVMSKSHLLATCSWSLKNGMLGREAFWAKSSSVFCFAIWMHREAAGVL